MRTPRDDPMRLSRRRFLVSAGAGTALAGASGYALYALLRGRGFRRPRLDPGTGTGRLAEEDMLVMLALCEVLVPDRYRPDSSGTRRLLDEATTDTPGLLSAYRGAVDLLRSEAEEGEGAAFESLAPERRDALLGGLLWRVPSHLGEEMGRARSRLLLRLERLWHEEARRRLRELVVRDLLMRLYLHAQPRLIGYANVPGVPGDPRAYVTPPAAGAPRSR